MRSLIHWLTQNITPRQTVLKNTFWLFVGQIVSRLLRAAIVIYAARVLGVSSWGAFSYALGVVTFLTVFSDIGVNGLITREGSRDPAQQKAYLGSALLVKLLLLLVVTGVTLLIFPHLSNIKEATLLMPILIFVFAADTLRDLGSALSRALQKMQIEALLGILTNAAIVGLGFLFLSLSPSSTSLAFAYALGSVVGLVGLIVVLSKHIRPMLAHVNFRLAWPILKTAWPFGLMGMLGVIMLNTDIIMVGWMRGAEEVGYYSAAQKLLQLLYVLPGLFASSMFPLLARLVTVSSSQARLLLERTISLSILIAIPIALVGIILGKPIIGLLFGAEYLPAVRTFQILMVTVLFTYPSILIGNAIFAYDLQRYFVRFVLLATFGNIGFNFLLIPRFGIQGAAMATLLTQIIVDTLMWWEMRKQSGVRILPQILSYMRLKKYP